MGISSTLMNILVNQKNFNLIYNICLVFKALNLDFYPIYVRIEPKLSQGISAALQRGEQPQIFSQWEASIYLS